jgi:hypothetical protein
MSINGSEKSRKSPSPSTSKKSNKSPSARSSFVTANYPNGKYEGQIKYPNGKYERQIKDGIRDGYGKMTYKNGDIFEGKWDMNIKDGKGKMTYTNGDVYEGELLLNNKKSGEGKMIYTNGDVYEGEWHMDKKDGEGKMTYKNGQVYEGEWRTDEKHGKGKLTSSDGAIIFDGKWVNDKEQTMSRRAKKKLSAFYQTLKQTLKNKFGRKKSVTKKQRDEGPFFKPYDDIYW